jgi:hypothetical protein
MIPSGKLKLFILLCCIAPFSAWAQDLHKEKQFIEFLVRTRGYEKAIYAIDHLDMSSASPGFRDSMMFYKSISHFSLQQLEASIEGFAGIHSPTLFYPSRFLGAYGQTYQKQYDRALLELSKTKVEDTLINALKSFQEAGIHLLRRDTAAYRSVSAGFQYKHFALSNEERALDNIYMDMASHNQKSYLMAGIMSAVLPGSGKIYAGKLGEGLYALISSAVLAAITYENYTKAGPTHIKTLFFGGLFATFYIGNIYGSVASVKQYRTEFNESTDHSILFNLHIPLRTLFLQ